MTQEQEHAPSPEERRQHLFEQVNTLVFGEDAPIKPKLVQNGCEVVTLRHGESGVVTVVHHPNFLNHGDALGIQYATVEKNPKNGDPVVTKQLHGAMYANGDVVSALAGDEKRKKEQNTGILFTFTAQAIRDKLLPTSKTQK